MQKITKQDQRFYCLSQRNSLDENSRVEFSKIINNKLINIVSGNICSYISTDNEVSTKIINCSFNNVAFPVLDSNHQMEMYIPNDKQLLINKYGIYEPNPNNARYIEPDDIDYIIVPVVGFDENCNRNGHGGGYYDRYLKRCPKATKIGIAYECQKVDKVIVDKNDFQLDMIITETNTYKRQD